MLDFAVELHREFAEDQSDRQPATNEEDPLFFFLGLQTSVFAVSRFYQLTGSQLSWLVLSELVVLPGEP